MDTGGMIDAERTAVADLADSLTPAQWDAATLCTAWKTRDVVAHRSTPPGAKPEDVLVDHVVHEQDIRRPLGLARTISPDTLRAALDRVVGIGNGLLPAKNRSSGLRLRATDIGWEHGEGEEVSGPGEAVLISLAGRADALDELSGPGLATLRARVGG